MEERTTSWEALRLQKAIRYASRMRKVGIFLPSDGSGFLTDSQNDPPDRHNYKITSIVDITSNVMAKRSVGDIVNGDPDAFGMKT